MATRYRRIRLALLRRPGTHNSKRGEPVLVATLWGSGEACDLTEVEALIELLSETGLLTPKPGGNGGARAEGDPRMTGEYKASVDVAAEFASIHDGGSANIAQCRVIPSLLRKVEHPGDVLEPCCRQHDGEVASRLRWTREAESEVVRQVASFERLGNLLLEGLRPATGIIPSWLPGVFHEVG